MKKLEKATRRSIILDLLTNKKEMVKKVKSGRILQGELPEKGERISMDEHPEEKNSCGTRV